MKRTLDLRLDSILKASLPTVLRPLGFRKTRRVFVRRLDDLYWLIDVQKSRWSDKDQASFTLNAGVHVPGVLSVYINRPEPTAPSIDFCCLIVRVGMLSEERRSRSWKLRLEDDEPGSDDRIAVDVLSRVDGELLPFLQRFNSRRDVVSYLQGPRPPAERFVSPQENDPRRLPYLAILQYLLNEGSSALSTLEQAEEVAKGKPLHAHIRDLRTRIQRT